MWSCTFYLGNFLGPTLAGLAVEKYGFRGFVLYNHMDQKSQKLFRIAIFDENATIFSGLYAKCCLKLHGRTDNL